MGGFNSGFDGLISLVLALIFTPVFAISFFVCLFILLYRYQKLHQSVVRYKLFWFMASSLFFFFFTVIYLSLHNIFYSEFFCAFLVPIITLWIACPFMPFYPFKERFLYAWHGKEKLRVTFWGYWILLGGILMFNVFWPITLYQNDYTSGYLVAFVKTYKIFIPFTLVMLVINWRCSKNTTWKRGEYLVRGWIMINLIVLVPTLLFIIL